MRSLDVSYLIDQLRRLLDAAWQILLALIAIRLDRWWRVRQVKIPKVVADSGVNEFTITQFGEGVVGVMPLAGRSRYQRRTYASLMPTPAVLGKATVSCELTLA